MRCIICLISSLPGTTGGLQRARRGPRRPPVWPRGTRSPIMGESGKAVARTGLRMMPTSPPPPLKFRTVGFPQYGFKASLSAGACPSDDRVKLAPSMPRQAFGLLPPSPPPDYGIHSSSGS